MDCLAQWHHAQRYSLHFTQNLSLRIAHAAVLDSEEQHIKEVVRLLLIFLRTIFIISTWFGLDRPQILWLTKQGLGLWHGFLSKQPANHCVLNKASK
jgi:hypothetical protein